MFANISHIIPFSGNVEVGDLLELHSEMMLVDPRGPVLVLKADETTDCYEVMYTSNNYIISVSSIDIKDRYEKV